MGAGDCFGELAALGLTEKRSLTVRAKSAAVVYELDGGDFKASFADRPEVRGDACGMRHAAEEDAEIWIR